MAAFASVDAYLAAQPEMARAALAKVCETIRATVPEALESISYNIPAWKIGGSAVIFCAAWKKHFSLYLVSAALLASISAGQGSHDTAKGTIGFPYTVAVPVALIDRIVRARAAELRQERR